MMELRGFYTSLILMTAAVSSQRFNPPRSKSVAFDPRSKQRFFGASPTNAGPNRCQGGFTCCPGWNMNPSTRWCTIPTCRNPCGFGICRTPNLCQCMSGGFGAICPGSGGTHTGGCQQRCMNGGQCQGQKCICAPGYVGLNCEKPICRQPCLNSGRCIGPNRCACPFGYSGLRCELDLRTGPCFTRVERNMCRGQLVGVKCSKESCCATVGAAWGIPCQKCPEKLGCKRGFFKDPRTGKCSDINECRGIPNICAMGTCINTPGSYRCECGEGRRYNPEKFECTDIDECSSSSGMCEFGKCVNIDGSYKCICDEGYKSSDNGKRCVVADVKGTCYAKYNNGQCQTPTPNQVSKKQCCCGNFDRAFGSCNKCPAKGTDEYRKLGCYDDSDKNNGGNNHTSGGDGDKKCQDMFSMCDNGKCRTMSGVKKCVCNPGFAKDKDNYCADINECNKFSGMCHGGKCINTPGSFRCKCAEGYSQSTDGYRCVDVDECKNPNTCTNGICKNFPGTYQCRCNRGYKSGPNNNCIDNNECLIPNICPGNGKCLNTDGSYRCECAHGYKLNSDKICVDIDECSTVPNICAGGYCVNIGGSFKCTCPAGFELAADERSCKDRNECSYIPDICYGGKCINGEGSFRCQCDYGWKVSEDGTYCIDTRVKDCYAKYNGLQCSMPLSKQLTAMQCCCGMENTGTRAFGNPCKACPKKGTKEYKRICMHGPGVDENGKDIDECKNNAGMTLGICNNGRCVNMMKDYKCVCNSGFKNPSNTNRLCKDINECTEFNLCNGGTCTNTPGGYRCVCPQGHKYNQEKKSCEDENECDNNPCVGGTCTNTAGSFRCDCPSGSIYDAARRLCKDQREGNCYAIATDNKCSKNIASYVSKSECCNGLGQAWGNSCEKCSGDAGLGCEKGYKRVGTQCQNIDECSFSTACQNGRCVDTIGSFRCICPTGYELDASGSACVDVRVGVCYRSVKGGQCGMPLVGELFMKANCCCSSFSQAWGSPCEICPLKNSVSYKELCPKGEGFEKNGEDMNECKVAGICKNGRCINTPGAYKCECNAGFDMDETGTMCVDINECEISKSICGRGQCINTYGSFRCRCESGFRNDMMMEMCVDINECVEMNPLPCRSGKCVNTAGSFRCVCPQGLKTMGDGNACEDIDECEQPGICPNGVCQNFIGSYHCRCLNGYRPSRDMKKCFDVDECSTNNGGCEYSCTNTDGSFRCSCRSGFELRADRKTCTDINECTRGTPCGVGNRCTNTVGGYVCSCTIGYRVSRDGKACVDIDECREDSNACQNGDCLNTAGSYLCNCRRGYKLETNAMVCIDIDECKLEENGGCHADARCINNVGSFRCQCKSGYDGDGKTCRDTNECALGLANCAQDAECVNTVGSFNCKCKPGFTGDGELCLDVDECLTDDKLCRPGTCMNSIGGYKCDCPKGYEPSADGRKCLDKNECTDPNLSVCDHGYCINTEGSYTCQCKLGFQLDKTKINCVDINECEFTGMCTNGVCKNMMGMYKCICDKSKGFMPNSNETGCIDMRMGYCYSKFVDERTCNGAQLSSKQMMKQFCCCSAPDGSAWQDDSNEACEACPVMQTADYKSLCPGGPSTHVNETTNKINKHNGCDVLENYCRNGECVDTGEQGISCTCYAGYKFNKERMTCEDIDECETDGICGFGARCINREPSYECVCPAGYTYNAEQKFCQDNRNYPCYFFSINPSGKCVTALPIQYTIGQCCCGNSASRYGPDCKACPAPGTGQRQALCVGKPTLPTIPTGQPPIGPSKPPTQSPGNGTGTGNIGATDKPVTTIDPKNDINECFHSPKICGKGKCINTIGGYRCQCDQGFKEAIVNFTRKCYDIDECENNPCDGGTCNNIEGAFFCSCPEGMQLDGSNLKCVEMDECKTPGYCEHGTCTNLPNGRGFLCDCNEGYVKSANGKTCEDKNECSEANICKNGACVNLAGSYRCDCNNGFKKNAAGDCVDVDECLDYPDLCRHGSCNNLFGSFMCECNNGFKQDATKQSCQDINECREAGFCENGRCRNTIGSATCTCNSGFEKTRDGRSCEDINECEDEDNRCQYGGTCVNVVGTFRCLCNPGFVSDKSGRECTDIRRSFCFSSLENNQCTRANGLNITKSVCCCSMGAGFGDPCELCPEKGTKEFEYYCPNGVGLTRNNTDINECEANLGTCINGNCVNTDGSFRCACDEGFVLNPDNPRECIDKDECAPGSTLCGNGNCTNLIGSYRCSCEQGFRSGTDSPACVDIDECADQKGLCAFRCVNQLGSYTCSCPKGFKLGSDRKHCEDINECETPHICPFRCKNIIGGYRCLCPEGYRRDIRGRCIEINECLNDPTLCRPGGFCQNIEGGYRCDCTPPYMRSNDGKFCQDKSMGLCFSNVVDNICQASSGKMEKVSQRDCCCSGGGTAWGTDCRTCPNLNTPEGRSLCTGYKNRTVDECKFIAGVCKNGKCMDTTDSFRCMCNAGYKLTMNGKKCEDKDECNDGTAKCPNSCRNTDASYECICPKGYVINENKTQCVDIDECSTGNHDCQNGCENTEGGYKCICPAGFRMVGKTCVDTDECTESGICGLGTCRNTVGSYECLCGRGLKFDKTKKSCVYITDGKKNPGGCIGVPQGCGGACPQGFYRYYNQFGGTQCVDVNECRQNMCGQSTCINTLGSYQCTCPTGYTYQGGRCQDANACARSPCSFGCLNNRGGFACQCPPGYFPVTGGHCVATGATCFSCDTSDIPKEGVPLGGKPTQSQSGHQSAIGGGSVPLSGGSNAYNPRQPYVPPYTGGRQETGGFSGFPAGGFQQQQYKPYGGFAYRRRRSTSKHTKPVHVMITRKTKPHVSLMKLVAQLKDMTGHMDYNIIKGNATLFELVTGTNGRTSLQSTDYLIPGSYNVAIKGDIKKDNSEIEEELKAIYRDAGNFILKVNVRVL